MIHAIRSGSVRLRLAAVQSFLQKVPKDAEVLLVGASRGAADDCARAVTAARGASFGLHRLSAIQLATRLGGLEVAGRHLTPITRLGFEALASRATFEATYDSALVYLQGVTASPGFSPALAATLTELRARRARPADLVGLERSGRDLAILLERVEHWMEAAGLSDRTTLFEAAIGQMAASPSLVGVPVVLLDPSFESRIASEFLLTLARRSTDCLITVADGDARAVAAINSAGIPIEDNADPSDTDLTRLQCHLFEETPPSQRNATGEMVWLSAPGEARECVEIARHVLQEASRGVRFDEMAVLLRSPQQYVGLIEHAFSRAGISAHFDRGTKRPDPAGRAFLALLSSAVEGLSAKRFAEYLSLDQVPSEQRATYARPRTSGDDEDMCLIVPDHSDEAEADLDMAKEEGRAPRIRAPWRWERLLVESAVIGGADRWLRRLNGLANELRMQLTTLQDDDPDNPRIDRLTRELEDLRTLQSFALPIIQEMSRWPARATWGVWLAALEPFSGLVLRHPERVLQVLASFRPMTDVGPVTLAEVRDILTDPLGSLYDSPSTPRYGSVFVADLDEARGRAFKVVFVPGLAERQFPRGIREDPLLVDDLRTQLGGLLRQDDRAALERLSLRLAVGAATDRLYTSFPRLDASGGRGRVPSFYALELIRAVTGQVPTSIALQQAAADSSGAVLAWPAPVLANSAIDNFEHDLSVLRGLMAEGRNAKGKAQYIVQLNDHLRRSLISQYQRARASWTSSDGIVKAAGEVKTYLASQRLCARAYSVSALQRYAACPYQFLLSAVYRLAPPAQREALQRMDPLIRGALFHRVQAEVLRTLADRSLLPFRPDSRQQIRLLLDETIGRVAADFAEILAPAIERVWLDEIAAMTRDLYVWIDSLIEDEAWEPWRFEFAFGLADQSGRDEHSLVDPVTIDARYILRGSVDLIDKRRGAAALRVTDYKTSRTRVPPQTVVGGGTVLQPLLYSLAVEAATGSPVESARLWYCTSAGGFHQHLVSIDGRTRRHGLEVLEIVDRAVELGIFPAAPNEKACNNCDFRTICGPNQERSTRLKSQDLLGDLTALRRMR